jgi:hypothetical protein
MSKPRVDPTFGISSGDVLIPTERHPACRQREARSGSCTERENLAGDAKGKGASGSNREAESTDAPERGGLPCSIDEAGVMLVERRGQVTDVGSEPTGQRCQIHKARNIMERLSPALHASVRRALRQAWELNDAAKAEKLIRNLAQRLERDAPGVSKSILEGLDEILTVSRLGLPAELRRSLACTNIIENMMGTVRRVTRNVKRWSSPSMALRWTAAAMNEAKKGFRRLKAYKQLPALRVALAAHYEKETNNRALVQTAKAA